MTDRELQALIDARPSPEAAAKALEALPPAERREARQLLALARLSAAAPRPALPAGFVGRTLARARTRPAPRRTVLGWLLAPRVSPLGAAAAVAAAALLTLGVRELRALPPGPAAPVAVAVASPVAGGAAAPPQVIERVVRLRLEAPGARTVELAGDFNGWRPAATPLRRAGAGSWTVDVPLQPGRRYQYMFVVDGQWVTDPAAPVHVDDGFGNANAILDL